MRWNFPTIRWNFPTVRWNFLIFSSERGPDFSPEMGLDFSPEMGPDFFTRQWVPSFLSAVAGVYGGGYPLGGYHNTPQQRIGVRGPISGEKSTHFWWKIRTHFLVKNHDRRKIVTTVIFARPSENYDRRKISPDRRKIMTVGNNFPTVIILRRTGEISDGHYFSEEIPSYIP